MMSVTPEGGRVRTVDVAGEAIVMSSSSHSTSTSSTWLAGG